MQLNIDNKFFFNFKQSGKVSESEPLEWFASSIIDDEEVEFLFNEKIFYNRVEVKIDWKYIHSFLSKFIENKDLIFQKSHNILLALNKEIDAWNEEKRTIAKYELLGVEIIHTNLFVFNEYEYKQAEYDNLFYRSSFQLTYKYIGLNDDNYFIDSPYATWYVNFFNGIVLQGVSREVR